MKPRISTDDVAGRTNNKIKTITGLRVLEFIGDELDILVCADTNAWEDVSGLRNLKTVVNGCEGDAIIIQTVPACAT